MSGDDFDAKWVGERTIRIVLGAVDGDGEEVASALGEVGQRYGDHGVYCVCCALANAVIEMAGYERDRAGFWGMEAFDLKRGAAINPDDAGEDAQDVVQAMRFITAYLNRDTAQQMALFDAGLDDEHALILPAGLIKLVGIHGRAKLEEGAS